MASYFSNLALKGKLREAIHFICERETREGYYLMNRRITNRPLWIKLSWKYCQWKICTRNPTRCCVGSVWGNACFYPRGYYGGCGRDSCAKKIRERRAQWNISEALQGWVLKFGDHSINLSVNVKYFVVYLSKKNTMGRLPGIYVRSPDYIG